jgi:hypothetical protein
VPNFLVNILDEEIDIDLSTISHLKSSQLTSFVGYWD